MLNEKMLRKVPEQMGSPALGPVFRREATVSCHMADERCRNLKGC